MANSEIQIRNDPHTPLLDNLTQNSDENIRIIVLEKEFFIKRKIVHRFNYFFHRASLFLIDLYTFQFIDSLIGKGIIECSPRHQKIAKVISSTVMRVLQIFVFTMMLLILLLQLILFFINPENYCVNYANHSASNLTNDFVEDIFLVTANLTFSVISLGSVYFLYVNSDILRELKFDICTQTQFDSVRIHFPTGKNRLFPFLAVFLAYLAIFISLCYASYAKQLSYANIFFIQELVSTFSCPDESLDLYQTLGFIQYVILSTVYLYWHLSPLIACSVTRIICNQLQNETDKVIREIKIEILNCRSIGMSSNKPKPLLAYYNLIEFVNSCSNRVFYVSTLNIGTVLIVVANLFGNFFSNYSQGSGYLFSVDSAAVRKEAKSYEYLWLTLICIYQIISVLLMSASVIALNSKLTKFNDSILTERQIREFLHQEEESKLLVRLRQELLIISGSRARFEISLFGDMSSGFVYGVILIGVTLLMAFIADAYYMTFVQY